MDQQINSSSLVGGVSEDATKRDMKDAAQEFLGLQENQKRIKAMIGKGQRLSVSIDEIRQFAPKLSQYITKNPIQGIKMFEDQLNVTVQGMQEDQMSGKQNSEKTAATSSDIHFPKKLLTYYINFEGNFGKNYVTPRGLKANLVNNFV
jgi:hypothetical protein